MTTFALFQRGFNSGYILGKHTPKLSLQLIEGVQQKKHPYIQGFIAGNLELLKELDKDKSQKLNLDKSLQNDLGLSLERNFE